MEIVREDECGGLLLLLLLLLCSLQHSWSPTVIHHASGAARDCGCFSGPVMCSGGELGRDVESVNAEGLL